MAQQRIWFERWIGGETVAQLLRYSPHSRSTLQRILLRELTKPVPVPTNLEHVTHVIFDAKFLFGRKYCLLVLLDAETNQPVAGTIASGETRPCITTWLESLRQSGLNPTAVTTDGHQAGIYSFKRLWPDIAMQRCLFHVRMQCEAWCRSNPKYDSAKALKQLCVAVCRIRDVQAADAFSRAYYELKNTYRDELSKLDSTHPIQSDILKAYQLLNNALGSCFHYIEDPKIAKTTSALEGYFKHIQRIKGFQHNGLTEKHLFQFLAWKIYYDTQKKHTF